jgi:hypothetical protein
LFGGDLGLGFDLGFTYYPSKNKQLTASLVDVGFVSHSKDVESFTYKGVSVRRNKSNFTGTNVPKNVYEEFKNAIPLDTLYKYTTWRPMKFNSSYQYSSMMIEEERIAVGRPDSSYKSAVGAQLFIMTAPRPIMALTGYVRQPF